jgi:hypothetical protein
MDAYEAKVHHAIEAIVAVLEDAELTYPKQRIELLSALSWLEMDMTCGDCKAGGCHGAPQEECGCRRHEASVEAAVRGEAIKAWAVNGAAPLVVEGR